MRNSILVGIVSAFFIGGAAARALADVKSLAVREVAESVLQRFGIEAAEGTVDAFSARLEATALRHGDDALKAVERIGPRAIPLVEEAGANGGKAAKLIAEYGEEGAWIVSRPKSMALYAKYGESAATALIKHPGASESLLAAHGEAAAEALNRLNAQNGRRLAMMLEEGELAELGRTQSLLRTVGKHGDRAMDFVWRNKGALAVATALGAFLADPRPFLDGTRQLSQSVVENIGKPMAEVPKVLASEAARDMNWTWIGTLAVVIGGLLVALRMVRQRKLPAHA